MIQQLKLIPRLRLLTLFETAPRTMQTQHKRLVVRCHVEFLFTVRGQRLTSTVDTGEAVGRGEAERARLSEYSANVEQ